MLREKYQYSGRLEGVPPALIDFVSSRSAGSGKPIFIELLLQAVHEHGLLSFELDDVGEVDAACGMIVTPVTEAQLGACGTPKEIQASVMQHFDALDPSLQMVLKLSSPMPQFSEAMLYNVGLPEHVVRRLPQLLNTAKAEGVLHTLEAIPPPVVAADPGATRAWSWRMRLMRQEARPYAEEGPR